VDTVAVRPPDVARVVIDARDGTVVAGGELRIASAVVSHAGVTLQIGGGGAASEGLVEGPRGRLGAGGRGRAARRRRSWS
jgi:flagellar P-ring protein precursor FlgI